MKIFKIILITIFSIGITKNTIGQSPSVNSLWEQRAVIETHNMKVRLSLDSLQFQQIMAINMQYHKQVDSVNRTTDPLESKQDFSKEANKERTKQIKDVLNVQQFQQYKQDKESMKNRMISRRKRNDIPSNTIED